MQFHLSNLNEALETIEFYLEMADQAGFKPAVVLAPIDGVYEILGEFFEVGECEYIGLDNEYVSEDVAFKLANDFGVPVMIMADTIEELDEIYGVPT